MQPAAAFVPARRRLLPALALLVASPGLLAQRAPRPAEAKIGDVVISDEKDASDSLESFEPGTAMIYLTAQLLNVPQGARVAASWVAVSTKVAPRNYVIDSAELVVTGKVNVANFSLSKPNGGWPIGRYRVDLSINGRKAGSTGFKVRS